MSTTPIEEYISHGHIKPARDRPLVKISDLQAYKKEIDDLKERWRMFNVNQSEKITDLLMKAGIAGLGRDEQLTLLEENERLRYCIEKNWGKSGADILKEKDDHEEWRLKLASENDELKYQYDMAIQVDNKEIACLKDEIEELTKEITQLQSPEPGWAKCPYGCKPAGVYRDRYCEIQVELGVCCDHEDLITEIRDLVTKNKRLQDQVKFLYEPICADDYIRLAKNYDESRAHVERLLRGVKRLTKANEKLKKEQDWRNSGGPVIFQKTYQSQRDEIKKLKEEIVEKDKAKRCLCPPRLGVRAGYTDEEWDVLGAAPIKEGEPQIIDYYHN
tara:strand:- start:2420 stop:3412 length:993 start_codon:yes stop_codon:yes gene_type:complete